MTGGMVWHIRMRMYMGKVTDDYERLADERENTVGKWTVFYS